MKDLFAKFASGVIMVGLLIVIILVIVWICSFLLSKIQGGC